MIFVSTPSRLLGIRSIDIPFSDVLTAVVNQSD